MKTGKTFTSTLGLAAGAVLLSAGAINSAHAAPVDADIMYVIDRSGSMSGEFDFLGGAIDDFLSDLQDSDQIGNARAGLISYEDDPRLDQGLTDNATDLSDTFNGITASGGTENLFAAMDAAMPGGNTDPSTLGSTSIPWVEYGENAVKSLVVITDEEADDEAAYSNGLGDGSARDDMAALLDENGFLNNIIRNPNDWDTDEDPPARPSGALFSIGTFRDNQDDFFADFTDAKIQEIEETTEVPAPATLALFGLGLLGLGGLLYARRESD